MTLFGENATVTCWSQNAYNKDEFMRKDYLHCTACGVTTCGVSGTQAKERGHIFYCNLWKIKSCGDSLFSVSASRYFVFRFPQIRSVCLPVCFLQLSGQRSLTEKLTLSCVVQTAVKTHSTASHISSSWFCLSARLPPTASVTLTPGDNVQALICQIAAV